MCLRKKIIFVRAFYLLVRDKLRGKRGLEEREQETPAAALLQLVKFPLAGGDWGLKLKSCTL